jgi:hypothetical protein
MYNREWFRLYLLSLYLMFHIIPTRGADIPGGIAGWVIRQSVQVIAGVMGVKASDYLLKDNGLSRNAEIHYKIDSMIQDNKNYNNAQSVKVDTANQGGAGTASEKRAPSEKSAKSELKTSQATSSSGLEGTFGVTMYNLDVNGDAFKKLHEEKLPTFSDKEIKKEINRTENFINSRRRGSTVVYQHPEETKKIIASLEKHLELLNKELESRKESGQKERFSKQATTTTASAVVMSTQTAPVSAPQPLEAVPGENIWKKVSRGSDKPEFSEQQLQEMKESRKERKAREAKEKEERNKELNGRDPGEPPHKSKEDLRFVEKDQPGQHEHQWRKEGGHFEIDTPTARDLIRRAVKEGTYRGIKKGKHQYDWINPETGEQIWVETIGNKIQNHGINVDPWKTGATGFLQRPEGYVRANVPGVIRCDATGAIVWPFVPALIENLENGGVKSSPLPDTEVRKLADAALNNYLKENPISGNIIKMPMSPISHTTPGAHKEDGFIVPYKPTMLEKAPKDYTDKYQWWPFTNDHLPSDFPEAPEVWAGPSKIAQYEKAVEMYKNKGGFAGNYKKYDYGNTEHIWKKGDPAPGWAKPGWSKGIK